MTTAADEWANATNLLCLRLDGLGDLLMTTPALRALKESQPGRKLTLLVSSSAAPAAALIPDVDDVIIYDAPWIKASIPRADSKVDFAMMERLRKSRFDGAVVFTVFSQNPLPAAFFCMLADIPRRLGHCRENPYQLLSHWVKDPEPAQFIRHEVRRHLDLVATIGCATSNQRLSLRIPASAARSMEQYLDVIGITPQSKWILIHPGATAPSRRYPPELFAAAARELALQHDYTIVFAGSNEDQKLVAQIQQHMRVPSLSVAGLLGLPELAALIARAPLLIANNSSPAHIAASVRTPVVGLYALTNPQHTPWGVASRVLSYDTPCKYCYKSICPEGHHNCLRRVPPGAVVNAALELLHDNGASKYAVVTRQSLPELLVAG